PAELRVVVLDVAGGQLPHPLHLDIVDDSREDLLAGFVAVADGDPDQLAAAVLHALVAEADRRGLAPALELVHEDRGVEVEHVHGENPGRPGRRLSICSPTSAGLALGAGAPGPPEERPEGDRQTDL